MKYSLNWLKDYLKTDKTPEEIADIIVKLGSDVESIERYPYIDERVIVAEIKDVSSHPDADRLSLAKVFTGEEEIDVVCGAKNIAPGQKVPLAQVGTRIGDLEIKEAEIRGQKSKGMLMSERELGLGEDHSGIFLLDDSCKIGNKVSALLGKDTILDVEITPNRGDLLSHYGMARDIVAFLGQKLEAPEIKINNESETDLKIEIKSKNCSEYLARVIRGVKVKESPDWLKERLTAAGAKPINNIVDVTNYIMLDLGQPLHAFDRAKISGGITVKEIEQEMDVLTLDGESRALLPGMLGIWDGERPIAVAGVMGLGNSEVDESTTDIVLEAAVFDRKSIRKTAKLLNLKTEASARFERGINENGVQLALDKAAKLIQEIAGGATSKIEKQTTSPQEQSLSVEHDKINQYADLNFSHEQIDKILENLGFNIEDGRAVVPAWRHDIFLWQDLAEEVYRINGLDKISSISMPHAEKPEASDYYKKEAIKDFLCGLGLDESISYTFLSELDIVAAKIDPTDLLEVANPIQEENKYLRNSLVPGLLKAVSKNPSFDDIEFYELGNVFSKSEEWPSLAIVTAGKSARKVEKVVQKLAEEFEFNKNNFKIYEISSDELTRFKIKKPIVYVAEARVGELLKTGKFDDLSLKIIDNQSVYRSISKYPPVKRDLAFVVDSNILSLEIRDSILEISSKVILAELFDEFSSDKLGVGKKSIAFHLWLEDKERTLSDKEADEEIAKVVNVLEKKFDAKLRD